MSELVQEKSHWHQILEVTLSENKEEIHRLVAINASNSSEIVHLREQATRTIEELTSEIQREVKEQEEAMKKTSEYRFIKLNVFLYLESSEIVDKTTSVVTQQHYRQ
jgi:hypothetical protein